MSQQTNEIAFSRKYQPLFGNAKTRYIVVTGGRGSGKSFALASGLLTRTYDDPYTILYTRYTMVSADLSIIPEYKDKIDVFNAADDFQIKRTDIVNMGSGGKILFRGLMQSSKNQIARLKSVAKLKVWVLDEAQELMSESLFDTVDLSIREKGVQNLVILVLNPTDISHWIYRRFFALPGVPDDFNGIRGDVTYIHTTWTDNRANLNQSFIDKAEAMRTADPEKYANIYGGFWMKKKAGLIYKGWKRIRPDEYPSGLPQWWANDWGYSNDPNALIRMCYDPARGILYLYEIAYTTGMLARDVAKAVIDDAATLVHHYENGEPVYYAPYDCEIYCDPARPESIAELRTIYDLSAMKGINKDKAGRIQYLQGFSVCYVGEHIGQEVETYSFKPNPQDDSIYTDIPQDGCDHAMDAINYGMTRLRGMGVNGDNG